MAEQTPEEKALSEFLAQDAGAGFEKMEGADFAPPFLKILQAISSELKPNNELYNPEAKQGQIVSTATGNRYERVHVIPVRYDTRTVVWRDRKKGGEGFVSSYDREHLPSEDQLISDPETGEVKDKAGNILIQTAYYLVMLQEENWNRVILPMARTQLKKSRKWNSLMSGVMIPGSEHTAPMYACVYELSTTIEQKGNNSWYGWKMSNGLFVKDMKVLTAAKENHIKHQQFLPERVLKAIAGKQETEEAI